MAWTRKLSRQGNTFILTIPKRVVENMGARQGDIMLCEQPFSRSMILSPLDRANGREGDEIVRAMAYTAVGGSLEEVCGRYAIQRTDSGVECAGCHLHPATRWIREMLVCDYCMREIGLGLGFRTRPSQTEMQLRAEGIV